MWTGTERNVILWSSMTEQSWLSKWASAAVTQETDILYKNSICCSEFLVSPKARNERYGRLSPSNLPPISCDDYDITFFANMFLVREGSFTFSSV